jgi:hypothetical protein
LCSEIRHCAKRQNVASHKKMTKNSIYELDKFLEENDYYSLDHKNNVDEINQLILDKWDKNLQDGIINDLKLKLKGIEIIKTRSLFDMISDEHGAPLYKLFLDLKDGDERIEVIVKLVINLDMAVIYLGSKHANENKFEGKGKTLKTVFKKLKKADKNFGYFLPIDFYKFTTR